MIIRECNNHDAEKFLQMLQQLDKETKFMLFEPGERKTTVEQMQKSIESIVKSNSLQLVVEDKDKIVGFLTATKRLPGRVARRAADSEERRLRASLKIASVKKAGFPQIAKSPRES